MTHLEKNQKINKLWSRREHGQALVLIALAMVVLIAAIGLATDASIIYRAKQDLQRTLDSAALAAAYKLPNQTNASKAAYEFARLHGYDFDPSGNKLNVTFPVYNPPRKAVAVQGSTNVSFAFLGILGFHTMQLSAQGEAESAPLDVYLILDLSQSMVYDTTKPSPWPPAGFTACSTWDSNNMYDCVAKYCNWARKCDPLDLHIKTAAKFFVDQLDPQFDRVGLVVYDQFGTKIIGLSSNYIAVKAAIDNINAFDHQGASGSQCPNTNPSACNKNTNIGDGIMFAHNGIASEGRMDAIWSMVLLTDGKANIYRSCPNCPSIPPNPSGCGALACQTLYLCEQCQLADDWAINNAKDTWIKHETVIYTIAYGTTSNDPTYQDLMKKVADWTDNGTLDGTTNNFWVAPDEAGLRTAMTEIAQRIYSRLLK
jgi:Flp pilus assembly protein TadG